MFPRNMPYPKATTFSLLLALILLSPPVVAQENRIEESDLAAALSFETAPANGVPGGWSGGPPGTIFRDDKIVHMGHGSARIERHANSAGEFSTITKSIPMDFSGSTLELRGFVRTEDVSNFAGLWMREDGETPTLAFDNMQNAQLKGTTDWKEYTIKLPLVPEARQLFLGFLW
jgi:hypothetical protein